MPRRRDENPPRDRALKIAKLKSKDVLLRVGDRHVTSEIGRIIGHDSVLLRHETGFDRLAVRRTGTERGDARDLRFKDRSRFNDSTIETAARTGFLCPIDEIPTDPFGRALLSWIELQLAHSGQPVLPFEPKVGR